MTPSEKRMANLVSSEKSIGLSVKFKSSFRMPSNRSLSEKDAGKGDQILIENFGETLSGEYSTEELMEMAIAAKVDGIIVQVSDEEAVSAQIDKAEEQNIPVITIRSDAPASKRVSFVSGNDYAIGEMYGNQINNIAQKKAEEEDRKIRVTVLLNSEERNAAPNVIFTAISETTASIASKIELTSKVIDNTGMFESEENVRDLILDTSYPDIIVCMSAVDTSSAIQCVVDYNKGNCISELVRYFKITVGVMEAATDASGNIVYAYNSSVKETNKIEKISVSFTLANSKSELTQSIEIKPRNTVADFKKIESGT